MREALTLALDFLMTRRMGAESVIDALQEALAQPEQEQTGIREIRVTETVKPAQPEQETVAIGCMCSVCGEWQRWTLSGMVCKNGHGGAKGINHRLYTAPPKRKHWVSLSDGQRKEIIKRECRYTLEAAQVDHQHLSYAIEAKLKELNK